jgi:hypothetical protein
MKDGLAMMGALVFSYAASPSLDSHVKEFRLFADVVNDGIDTRHGGAVVYLVIICHIYSSVGSDLVQDTGGIKGCYEE